MGQPLRDDYADVLLDWIARARRSASGKADLDFEVLSLPHRNSPFLTLAEEVGGGGLPWRVIKLLLVLDDDPSQPFWHDTLTWERDRWRREIEQRLSLPHRVETLGLPLAASEDGADELVTMAEIGPLRRRDLLAGTPPDRSVRFSYLVRPFIAWPRLCDVGYSPDQLKERWETYCQEHAVPEHLREPLFCHFCDEALTNGRSDLLLASAWRLEVLR